MHSRPPLLSLAVRSRTVSYNPPYHIGDGVRGDF
jgi:hypothetical protein